jgi:protocatechuate 3,4-dioxygenase beta subunit
MSPLDRRHFLRAAAALSAGAFVPGAASALPPRLLGTCPAPTPGATAGPFYLQSPLRQDITEGLSGMPFSVLLRVLDRATCTPIAGVFVEIWHADVPGAYSGFASEGTLGETFLRGAFPTDSQGIARLQTIYPGWYPGRTPHIHVRVREPGGAQLLTTQVYFDDAVSTWVYSNVAPYTARGVHTVGNGTDGLYRPDMELVLQRVGSGARGALTLTV